MHLERSFEHVLDEGGLRRATLQGTENLTKRHKIAAACFNLSLLMRTLLGVGTPKQWMREPIICLRLLPLTFAR
jgi:transposase